MTCGGQNLEVSACGRCQFGGVTIGPPASRIAVTSTYLHFVFARDGVAMVALVISRLSRDLGRSLGLGFTGLEHWLCLREKAKG